MYTKYIANPAHEDCIKAGYTDKSMRKRGGHEAFSPFSKMCGAYIQHYIDADEKKDENKSKLIADIQKALNESFAKVSQLKTGQYLGQDEPKRVDKRAGQP